LNILEIKNVNIYYCGKEVLREINIDVKKNEILCIMGPSGCGKSTLLSLINGFLTENGGEYTGDVILKGKNIRSMKPLQLRRSISTLFQDSKPFPLSIENNILYPIEFYEGKVKNRKERISNYLKDVNLYNEVKDDFKMSALKLSGGQKQRLCIARMLTTEPDILIFDEPCSSLDMENTLIIEKLIKRLSEKYTVILTTHNEEQAKELLAYYAKTERKEDGLYNYKHLPYRLFAEIQKAHTSVGWISMDHSSDYTELGMYGPGSEKLKPFMRNTDMHKFLLEVAEVSL